MKQELWNASLIMAIVLIGVSGYLIYYEMHGAKTFCESVDGEYILKFYPLPVEHKCNNQTLTQYQDMVGKSWDFESEILETEEPFNFEIIYP